MSELHKQNLAEVVGAQDIEATLSPSQNSSLAYRDRAKERRLKFGIETNSSSNSLKVIIYLLGLSHNVLVKWFHTKADFHLIGSLHESQRRYCHNVR